MFKATQKHVKNFSNGEHYSSTYPYIDSSSKIVNKETIPAILTDFNKELNKAKLKKSLAIGIPVGLAAGYGINKLIKDNA
jgi:hypothetical protein